MKKRIIAIVCVVALVLGTAAPSYAEDRTLEVAADVLLVRPGCIVATVLGSALFVVSLPFAAPSKSVKSTAHTLVVTPAKAAFARPVGDMETLQAY